MMPKKINCQHHINAYVEKRNSDAFVKERISDLQRDAYMVLEKTTLLLKASLKNPKLKANNKYSQSTQYFLVKGLKVAQSIELLCKNGLSNEASGLMRVLGEIQIKFEHFTKNNVADNHDRFQSYKDIDRCKSYEIRDDIVKSLKGVKGKETTLRKHMDRLLETKDEAAALFAKKIALLKKFNHSYKVSWSGHNTRELYRIHNKLEHYLTAVWVGSKQLHASALGAMTYIKKGSYSLLPNVHLSENTSLWAAIEILRIAKTYIEFHQIVGLEKLIEEIEWNHGARIFEMSNGEIEYRRFSTHGSITKLKWGKL